MTRYYSVLSNPYFQQNKVLIGAYFVEYKNTWVYECPYIRKNKGSYLTLFVLDLDLFWPYFVIFPVKTFLFVLIFGQIRQIFCKYNDKYMHNSRSFRPYFDLILSLMCPYTVSGALIDPYISLIWGGVDKYVALFLFRGTNMSLFVSYFEVI